MDSKAVVKRLNGLANPDSVAGMARFGINSKRTLGVSIPSLRKLAKEIGRNHELALELWKTEIHEARILAGMIDDPTKATLKQMDRWVSDFDSWDVCDQVCANLFDKTPFAFSKASEWAKNEEEFVRRGGFALMACLAWHDKTSDDLKFSQFFPLIKKYSTDDRNFVRKAVNWALRQIGKRNRNLNKMAIEVAKEIQKIDSKTAKWVAGDAIWELTAKAPHLSK